MSSLRTMSFSGEKISGRHEHSCDCHFPGWHIEDWTGGIQSKNRDIFSSSETHELRLPSYNFYFFVDWHTDSLRTHSTCCVLTVLTVCCYTNSTENKVQNTANQTESNAPSYKCIIPHFPSKHPRSNAPDSLNRHWAAWPLYVDRCDIRHLTKQQHDSQIKMKIQWIQIDMRFTEGARHHFWKDTHMAGCQGVYSDLLT